MLKASNGIYVFFFLSFLVWTRKNVTNREKKDRALKIIVPCFIWQLIYHSDPRSTFLRNGFQEFTQRQTLGFPINSTLIYFSP